MGGVAVVTDSTADLPVDLARQRGLHVVPMSVAFEDQTLVSGVEAEVADFYRRLESADELPTTSQPAPAWFEDAYAACAEQGADEVVSIHVSAALSGTVDLARQVGSAASLPVTVVDSRQVSGGLGLMVLAAQREAEAGGGSKQVFQAARAVGSRLSSMVLVDTLDYLRRGGRLTGAQALFGTVLRVRPILVLRDGRLEVFSRHRTWSRARRQLVDRAREHVAGRPARVMITHALAEERAGELLEALEEEVEVAESLTTPIGPVIGTHTGPGAVALAVCPEPGAEAG